MAIQKITADVIANSAVTTDSLSDSSITAAKLHTTLDLTGKTVTVATASAGDNDTTVASTAFVSTAIANLADSAPSTLDTLNELAAALGDDANFSTTVTNSIATKAPLATPQFTNRVGIGVAAHATAGLNITNTSQHIRLNNGSELGIVSVLSTGELELWGHGDDESINFRTGSGAGTVAMNVVGTNVGIGDTSPSAKLEIKQGSGNWYEGIRINRSDNATQFGTFSNNSGATFIGAADTAGGNNNAILFGNSTNGTTYSERMRIDSTGRVAIGTSSILTDTRFALHEGNVDLEFSLDNAVANTARIFAFDRGTTTHKNLQLRANQTEFYSGSSEAMRIASDGKLLINNTASSENGLVQVYGTKSLVAGIPQGLLQVSDKTSMAAGVGGGINFTGAYLSNGTHTSFASIEASKTNGTSGNYGGDLVFKTRENGGSQNERMRIDSAGTIFQGTTTPTLHSAVTGIVFENGSLLTDVTRGAGKSITLAQNAAVDSGNTWAYLATDEASYYQQFNGNHYFGTAPSGSAGADITMGTKMMIHNSGCIDLGANVDRSLGTNITTTVTSGSAGSGFWLSTGNSSATSAKIYTIPNSSVGDLYINQGSGVGGGAMYLQVNEDTKLRIASNGNISMGTGYMAGVRLYVDAPSSYHAAVFRNDSGAYAPIISDNQAGSGTRYFMSFRLDNTEVGKITSTGSTTLYGTSSDYRLKENVDYTWDATTRLKQLKPVRFNWIADETNTLVDGFLAHEVSSIVPEAVEGEKDGEIDENGNGYQGIDQSKLIPLLTKAMQEQQTIIDDLKSRIETLEG